MAVSATTPLDYYATAAQNAAATQNTSTSAGRTRMAENFDMFLTLLTTQLKNQDPTAPMDSNQFMSQLVQMTSVEQQLAGNELLEQLVANTGTSLGNVVGLIGKEVRAASDVTKLANGTAEWRYNLPSAAADVKIDVLDANGVVVRTISGDENARKAGDHTFTWDGKDADGRALPDGPYRLRITATDTANKSIASSVFVQGLVTAIEQKDGQGLVTINGTKIAISLITSVAIAANEQTPPPTTGGSTENTSGSGGGAADPDTNNPADQTSA